MGRGAGGVRAGVKVAGVALPERLCPERWLQLDRLGTRQPAHAFFLAGTDVHWWRVRIDIRRCPTQYGRRRPRRRGIELARQYRDSDLAEADCHPLIFRAVTVIALFLMIFGVGVVALSIAEHHVGDRETGMFNLMFEAMSALATAGVSTGVAPTLTATGKLILCALMLVGHLGPLITVYALQRRQQPERYRFPEEAVRIG